MKLFERSPIIFNLMSFLILSVFYIHVLHSLNEGCTAFNFQFLHKFLLTNKWLLVFLLTTLISVYFLKSASRFLVFAFVFFVGISGFIIFFDKFDKILLVLNFFYVLIGAYFVLLWASEVADVLYTPAYSLSQMGKKTFYNLEIEIEHLDTGVIRSGYMTNWDLHAVFVVLDDVAAFSSREVLVRIHFEGLVFKEYGLVMTRYGNGYGIKFVKNKHLQENSAWGWSDFYTIIGDRGYMPIIAGNSI